MGHCNKMERHASSAISSCRWSHSLIQSVVKCVFTALSQRWSSNTWPVSVGLPQLHYVGSGVCVNGWWNWMERGWICHVKFQSVEASGYVITLWRLWWFNSSQVLCRKWTKMLINNRSQVETSDFHWHFLDFRTFTRIKRYQLSICINLHQLETSKHLEAKYLESLHFRYSWRW